MSFAFLKSLLFSNRPSSVSPITLATEIKNCSRNPDLSQAGSSDLEAQQSDGCAPEASEPEKRRCDISPRVISDAIIGLSDGLTVPFALTAGLSSLGNTRLVVLGGLAELIAGGISMGLGGYLGNKSEAESYNAKAAKTRDLMETSPARTKSIVHSIFTSFRLPTAQADAIASSLQGSPDELLDFLMRFHYQIPRPDTSRPFASAITIALAYFAGGFIPLLPYLCVKQDQVLRALWISIGVMVAALFAFGWCKTGVVTGWRGRVNVFAGLVGGLEMTVIGSIAAGAAVGLVRAINHGM